MDCYGAEVLARLLCEDPACHLIAIILVNLTFADADLRRDLVIPESGIQLVESLAYALRVAVLSPDEFEARHQIMENETNPQQLLESLSEDEQQSRTALSDLDYNNTKQAGRSLPPALTMVNPAEQAHAETARWCLSALKNLTRPTKDINSAVTLVKTGALPVMMRIVSVGAAMSDVEDDNVEISENHGSQSSGSDETPRPAEP